MRKYKRVLYHIFFLVFYICYAEFDAYIMWPNRKVFIVSEAIYYIGFIWAFYFSYYFLTKNYYIGKKPQVSFWWFICSFIIFCIIGYQRYNFRHIYAPNNPPPQPFEIKTFLTTYFFDFILYTIYGAVFWLLEHNRKMEEDKIKLLHQTHDTEIKYLKAQMSIPLTLKIFDNLYNEALSQSKPLAKDIASLAELMRFSVQNSHNSLIDLLEEIKYTNLFIYLNQQRFNEQLLINFVTEGDLSIFRIPHLCLLTLVENAFKHGNLKLNPLDIHIKSKKNILSVSLKNMKHTSKITHSTGIGLENLKRRLSLLLEDKYILTTTEDDIYFYTLLTIKKI